MGRKRQSTDMHKSGEAAACAIDLLSPEILDLIVAKAAERFPQVLRRLARVSKSFEEAARRCVTTLVICTGPKQKVNKETRYASSACAALSKEISLRPKLSRLIFEGDALAEFFGAAVSEVHWTEVKSANKKQKLSKLVHFLSKNSFSLKRLDIGAKFQDRDMRIILQAFPNLESLGLLGTFTLNSVHTSKGQLLQDTAVNQSLTRLDIGSSVFVHLVHASETLPAPASLPALLSLRLQCYRIGNLYRSRLPASPQSLLTQIQTLHLDTMDGYPLDVMLQDVAQHCPSLKDLTLQTSPETTRLCSTLPPSRIELSKILEHCQDLETVTISRLEVVSGVRFVELISENGVFVENGNELKTKILVLEDGSQIASSTFNMYFKIYKCFVPLFAPRVLWNDPETPKRALGEAHIVQSWCHAFCGVAV